MKRNLLLFVAAVAFLISADCGGKGPGTSPTPTPVIQPPAQSFAKVTQTIPAAGATIVSADSWVTTTVDYGISQQDSDVAKTAGETIVVVACMSVDGKDSIPVCFTVVPSSGTVAGTSEHRVRVSLTFTPDIRETSYIMAYLARRPPTIPGQQSKADVPMSETMSTTSRTYYWK